MALKGYYKKKKYPLAYRTDILLKPGRVNKQLEAFTAHINNVDHYTSSPMEL